MTKIRILYDVYGWAYYWRAVALQKYHPSDYQVDIGSDYGRSLPKVKYDAILQLAYSYISQLQKHITASKIKIPIISSFNVGWNYHNDWLTNVIKHSDGVIINNYEMWEKYGKHPKTINISNGVDGDIFKLKRPIPLRKPKVIWIGSIFHRKTKNYDSILLPLSQKLRKNGIASDFRLVSSTGNNRMNQQQLTDWYNSGTVYVVASKTEGTPNPALEAASCGCTVVSTKVGNMPELIKPGINGYLCEQTIEDIYSNVLAAINNYQTLSNSMQNEIIKWHWKSRSQEYFNYISSIIKAYKK